MSSSRAGRYEERFQPAVSVIPLDYLDGGYDRVPVDEHGHPGPGQLVTLLVLVDFPAVGSDKGAEIGVRDGLDREAESGGGHVSLLPTLVF